MTPAERAILVVDNTESQAGNLKELIEFMDTPMVCAATPANWREVLGERRIAAVFLGPAVAQDEADSLLESVGAMDPNVPIVVIGERAAS